MNKEEATLEPEQYFEQFSAITLEFTTEFHKKVVLKIIDADEYLGEEKRFFFTIISKSVNSLEAANILVRNFNSKRNYHASLFIMLRAILTDIIVAEFVIIQGKNETERNELIKRINYDHIKNILNSIQGTAKIVYNWSEDETQKNINEIKESRSGYFNKDGSPSYSSISTSVSYLIRRIFSESSDREKLKLLTRAFDLYSTLSKYEHIGDLSFWLIHRSYDSSKMKELVYEFYDIVCIAVTAVNNYANLWDVVPKNTLKHLKSIENQIVLMSPEKLRCL